MSNDNRERAIELLQHYFTLACHGLEPDNLQEIAEIVDSIIAATLLAVQRGRQSR